MTRIGDRNLRFASSILRTAAVAGVLLIAPVSGFAQTWHDSTGVALGSGASYYPYQGTWSCGYSRGPCSCASRAYPAFSYSWNGYASPTYSYTYPAYSHIFYH